MSPDLQLTMRRKAGLPGQSGQSAQSHVALEPSSEEGHAMSPATLAEARPFRPGPAPLANVTIAVSVTMLYFTLHPNKRTVNLGLILKEG